LQAVTRNLGVGQREELEKQGRRQFDDIIVHPFTIGSLDSRFQSANCRPKQIGSRAHMQRCSKQEGYSRARPCPFRRSSHVGHIERSGGAMKNGGSVPCKADCQCISALDVGRGLAEGRRAGRRRIENKVRAAVPQTHTAQSRLRSPPAPSMIATATPMR
jgi:hypothetical protein